MHVEAIITTGDLPGLLAQFAPLTIRLGKHGLLIVSEPSDVTFVPGAGARVCCKARLTWTVLGLEGPVTLKSVTSIVRPEIEKRENGEALVFKLAIEHVDFAGVLGVLDKSIMDSMSSELVGKHVELSWNYVRALSHTFKLPESLGPPESFELCAIGGQVHVTAEVLRFTVPFRAAVVRGRPSPASELGLAAAEREPVLG